MGLIQEIFSKHTMRNRAEYDIYDITMIERDLVKAIEEIEMHNAWYNWEGAHYVEQVKKMLIGDSGQKERILT